MPCSTMDPVMRRWGPMEGKGAEWTCSCQQICEIPWLGPLTALGDGAVWCSAALLFFPRQRNPFVPSAPRLLSLHTNSGATAGALETGIMAKHPRAL